MAARRPRDGAAVAAASDENANPCKKARVDDDALRKTMATIGPPPDAPDPSAAVRRVRGSWSGGPPVPQGLLRRFAELASGVRH